MIVIDLPSLRSIELGEEAVCGRDGGDDDEEESCSLIMRSMNEIE